MAESTADSVSVTGSEPQPEFESATTLPGLKDLTLQEETSKETDLKKETTDPDKKPGGISLRIWPPTQKTRDAVLKRLVETLSTESILSKRYGTLKSEEASAVAKSIEGEAYDVASSAVVSDDDGIKILELYSKEISKRMLESVKARSNNNASVGNGTESVDDNDNASTDAPEVSKDDATSETEEKSEA